MDEPGPYLDSLSRHQDNGPSPDIRVEEKWERRVQGPEKPLFLGCKSLDDLWHKDTLDGRPSSSEPQSKKEKKRKSEKKDKIKKKKEKDKKKSKHRLHHHHRSSRCERVMLPVSRTEKCRQCFCPEISLPTVAVT